MAAVIAEVLRWFYCLELFQAAAVVILISLLFLWLGEPHRRRAWFSLLSLALLIFWGWGVMYITLGSREVASASLSHQMLPFHSYREVLAGGNPELLRSNFMNALLFFPAGILLYPLLPKKRPHWSKLLLIAVLAGFFSAGVEYLQVLRAIGHGEMDDVLHNLLGAVLGCFLSICFDKITGRPYARSS